MISNKAILITTMTSLLLSCSKEETQLDITTSPSVDEQLTVYENIAVNHMPSNISNLYRAKADYKVSDEFNGSTLDRNKWAYRALKDPTKWGASDKYVYFREDNGSKFVSIKGNWNEKKGSGISNKEQSHFGFYTVKWRTAGITKTKKTPWHPAIWYTKHNFASGSDFRNVNATNFTEIDFVEYWHLPIWHSQNIIFEDGKKKATQIMRPNNDDFPTKNTNWQIHGLEYNPKYTQLWQKIGSEWKKIGKRIPINNEETTQSSLNKNSATAGYWILSNKYHWDHVNRIYKNNPNLSEFKFADSWLHIDYFRYYPLK